MLRIMRGILIVMLNLIFYGLVIFFCVQITQYGHDFAYEVMGESSVQIPPGQSKPFHIREGQSDFEVASKLSEQGFIKNPLSFYTRMKLEESGRDRRKTGSVTLNTSMTYAEILDEIYGG